MPIFFQTVPMERPGVPFSIAKAQRPPHFLLLSSVAKTTCTSAMPPLVMKRLVPLRM